MDYMTARDVIDKLYGIKTYDQDDPLGVTTVNATSTRLVENNPNALQLTIINTGTNDINVWTDSTVSSTKGIRIAANGGSYEIDFTRFGNFPTREWWGIGIGGTSTVSIKRLNIL